MKYRGFTLNRGNYSLQVFICEIYKIHVIICEIYRGFTLNRGNYSLQVFICEIYKIHVIICEIYKIHVITPLLLFLIPLVDEVNALFHLCMLFIYTIKFMGLEEKNKYHTPSHMQTLEKWY